MMKILTTPSGKEIKLSSSAAFALEYLSAFGEDALEKIQDLGEDGGLMSVVEAQKIAWALAKCANKDIPPLVDFYRLNYDFHVSDFADEINELLIASVTSQVEVKNPESSQANPPGR